MLEQGSKYFYRFFFVFVTVTVSIKNLGSPVVKVNTVHGQPGLSVTRKGKKVLLFFHRLSRSTMYLLLTGELFYFSSSKAMMVYSKNALLLTGSITVSTISNRKYYAV